MCGLLIAPRTFPVELVNQALSRMSYRGAEGRRGIESSFGWHLGHVRLAIQDLSEDSNQPRRLKLGGALAFVGEIFTAPKKDSSELDYLEELIRCRSFSPLHQADGFWSLGYIKGEEALAVTDHLGIKPLYYWAEKQIVCSEITPMFTLSPRPPLDEVYLSNCIKWGYDYSGRTAFKGIQQLAPGQLLALKSGSTHTYWDWDKVPSEPFKLRDIIDQAILNRLIGDRPVSMLLSGGLDSSIIYYSLKKQGRQVQAFSAENGESEFLPPGVKTLELPSTSPREALEILQAPMDLGSLIPQVQLAKAVKEAGYNVCLTGDGADELFGGYSRARDYDSQGSDIFCELPYYHLPRLDRVMMSQTIELRSPYLAPQVVAAALKLKRPYRTTKQALKIAYADLLPQSILDREKHPLKTEAVKTGGLSYRRHLVEEFRHVVSRF